MATAIFYFFAMHLSELGRLVKSGAIFATRPRGLDDAPALALIIYSHFVTEFLTVVLSH